MSAKIVFLDRDTTDIGDIDFKGLESLGEVQYFGMTSPEEVPSRISEADIVLTNKVVINREAMAAAKNLKVIQVVATGVNNVDLGAAKDLGVKVFNVGGYSTPAVAQHVFALLLNLVTHVNKYAATPERWADSPIFTRLDYPVSELSGKMLGIVGYGDIGKAVGKIGAAFGMEVVAMARNPGGGDSEVRRLAEEEFFQQCDVITLHCPLTPENHHMINRQTLGSMKKSALLINTGRGDLVNEADLLEALRDGVIGGAGLDVISQEPPPVDHPVINAALPNLLVTPHTAWSSVEARQRLIDGVVENLRNSDDESAPNRVV